MTKIHAERAPALGGWGSRVQIGATVQALDDVEGGNADDLWGNEDRMAQATRGALGRSSIATDVRAFLRPGLSTKDDIARLQAFVARAEKTWGAPVVEADVAKRLQDAALFAAQKAIALTRLGRDPSTVHDAFVRAAGGVAGAAIAPRDLFVQHFESTGTPTGKVVVVVPGYLETGRNFYDQIAELNRAGHDVVVMDQQWAGQSEGAPGKIDRGFGVARDVAAVVAEAGQIAARRYGKGGEVALLANSMGAGVGALGACVLNQHGLVQLEGPPMPRVSALVAQAPYLAPTPSVRNRMLLALSPIPVLNEIALPAIEGLPELTRDRVAEQRVTQGAALEDARARLSAFRAVEPDLDFIRALLVREPKLETPLAVVHGRGDPLADFATSERLAEALGPERCTLVALDSPNHVLEQSPSEQHHAVAALETLLARAG